MRVVIIDGSPEARGLSEYIGKLEGELSSRRHEVKVFALRDLELKYCVGCWSCWWGPTCGECVFPDSSSHVWAETINSDLLVVASPVIMGFLSALLKQAQDKMPVLLHPYIEIVDGELRHRKRYDKYPKWGLLLEKGEDTDEDDIEIITEIEKHAARNLRSSLYFTALTTDSVKDVSDEIDCL